MKMDVAKSLVDGKYSIKDLVDLNELRTLFQSFTDAMGFTIGFLSAPELEILIATGWRDICTKYHRNCPLAATRCRQSNARLVRRLKRPGQIVIEACENGLVDCATPIIIQGKTVAILATGQVLLTPPNIEYFRKQAKLFGCNEAAYLKALKKVPVISEKKLKQATRFLGELAHTVIRMGYAGLTEKKCSEVLALEVQHRKKAESVLREAMNQLQVLYGAVTDGVLVASARTQKILKTNPSVSRMFGYSQKEFLKKKISDLYPPQEIKGVAALFQDMSQGKKEFVSDVPCRRRDGSVFFVDIAARVIFFQGQPCLAGFFRDTSERKLAEEREREVSRRLQAIFDGAFQFIAILRTNGKLLDVNQVALKFCRLTLKEVQDKFFWDCRWWAISKQARRKLRKAVAQASRGKFIRYSVEILGGGGVTITIDFSLKPVMDENGKVVLLIAEGRDITEIKRTEELLKQRDAYLTSIIENQPGMVWLKDEESRFLAVNRKYVKMTGKKKAGEVVGKTDLDFWPLKMAQKFRADDRKVMKERKSITVEELISEKGVARWHETFKTPVLGPDGKVIGTTGYARDITERRRTEAAMRESESRFRGIFESSHDAMMTLEPPSWRFTSANSAMVQIFRAKNVTELLSRSPWVLSPRRQPDGSLSHEKAKEMIQTAIRKGSHFFEWEHRRISGKTFPAEVLLTRVEREEGVFLQATVRDITARKCTEESLKEENAFRHAIIDRAAEGLCVCHEIPQFPYVKFTVWNERMVDITGYTMKEINRRGWYQTVYPDLQCRALAMERMEKMRKGKDLLCEEWVIVRKDGQTRTLSISTSFVPGSGGSVHVLGLMHDITMRKQAEHELRDTKERLEYILGATKTGVDVIDANFNLHYVDPAWQKLYGDPLGRKCYEYFMGRQEQCPGCGIPRALRTHKVTITEEVLVREGNRKIEVHTIPYQDSTGKWLVAEFNIDITERKRGEAALQEHQRQLRQIIDAVPHMIFAKDKDGRFLLANRAIAEAYQKEPETLVGVRRQDIHKNRQEAEAFLKGDREVLASGKPMLVSNEPFTDSRGGKHILQTIKIPFKMIGMRDMCILGVSVDVTEQRKVEEFRNDIVRTVSHELRTPLSIEKEGISLLMDGVVGEINAEQKEILQTVMRSIDRLARMITSLLDISSIEGGKIKFLQKMANLVDLVKDVSFEFKKRASENGIDLKVKAPESEVPVLMDPDKISQVLTNLVDNAIKFTPRGGSVEISLIPLKDEVECEVRDTGVGIAPENVAKAFEKFQQFAKTVGPGEKGFGLGLAIARGIIEMHKGRIWIKSEIGKGTRVTFSLPFYQKIEG
jgi:PAS domain S-box-containing protein